MTPCTSYGTTRKARRTTVPAPVRALREAPPEVRALLDTLAALLRPTPREQIKSPADVVVLLMVEMLHLDQEELRVLNLDTKNRITSITTVYRGSVNSAQVRISEVSRRPSASTVPPLSWRARTRAATPRPRRRTSW